MQKSYAFLQDIFGDKSPISPYQQSPLHQLATKMLARQPLPTKKNEEWRQTPFKIGGLSFDTSDDIDYVKNAKYIDKENIMEYANGHYLCFINGSFSKEYSTDFSTLQQDNIMITEHIKPHMHATELAELEKFFHQLPMAAMAVNKALSPLHIMVKGNPKHPLAIVHVITGNNGDAIYKYANGLIDLEIEEGAGLILSESVQMAGNAQNGRNYIVQNNFINIHLHKGAHLQHLSIDNSDDGTISFAHCHVLQQADSRYDTGHVMLGGDVTRKDLHIKLIEQQAFSSFQALMLPAEKQHFHISTNIEHIAPACNSHQLVKAIAANKAKGVYQGKIHIHPKAEASVAHQQMRAMLMDERAEISAKPELEIYADSVECAHGVAIGELDQAQIFYLQSRGIGKKDAIALLLKAYIGEVLEKWQSVPAWENKIHDCVNKRMAVISA